MVDMKVESEKPLDEKGRRVACQLTDYWGVLQAPLMRVMLEGSGTAYTATIHLTKTPLVPGKYSAPYRAGPGRDRAVPREHVLRHPPGGRDQEIRGDRHPLRHPHLGREAGRVPSSVGAHGIRRCLVFWGWPETPPHAPVWKDWDYDVRLGIPKELGIHRTGYSTRL